MLTYLSVTRYGSHDKIRPSLTRTRVGVFSRMTVGNSYRRDTGHERALKAQSFGSSELYGSKIAGSSGSRAVYASDARIHERYTSVQMCVTSFPRDEPANGNIGAGIDQLLAQTLIDSRFTRDRSIDLNETHLGLNPSSSLHVLCSRIIRSVVNSFREQFVECSSISRFLFRERLFQRCSRAFDNVWGCWRVVVTI